MSIPHRSDRAAARNVLNGPLMPPHHPYRARPEITERARPWPHRRALAGLVFAGALAMTPRFVPDPATSAPTRHPRAYPVFRSDDPEVQPLRLASHFARNSEGDLLVVQRDGTAWYLSGWGAGAEHREVACLHQDPVFARIQSSAAPLWSADNTPFAPRCRLTEDHHVACIPPIRYGRLRLATRARPLATDARFTQVSAMRGYACGVTTDATVRCWGPAVREVPGLRAVRAVAVRDENVVHWVDNPSACALREAGDVWCWSARDETPKRVEGLPPAVGIAASRGMTCARTGRGAVYCWGIIGRAWPGHPRVYRSRHALSVVLPAPALGLRREGESAMCATLRTGEERCWGGAPTAWEYGRDRGALGDDVTPVLMPPPYRSEPRFEPLLPDGRVLMRTRDYRGQRVEIRLQVRGDLPRVSAFIARDFEHLSSERDGELDTQSACALARDGRVWCWGTNEHGELGQDDQLPEDREALVHVLREP